MNKIYFSGVWEDYSALRSGLRPSPGDTVLSVCSAGDNIFNLLTDNVRRIIAIDINPAQLALAKSKLKIILEDEPEIAAHKLSQMEACGAFEKSFLPILQWITRRLFVAKNPDLKELHLKKSPILLTLIPVLFSFKFLYKLLLPDFPLQYINISIRQSLRSSLHTFIANNDFSQNWYLQRLYFGTYVLKPPFLRAENISRVRANADKITFVHGDVLSFLQQQDDESIDKINLSDIFDWCSTVEYTHILKEAHRVLTPRGRIFYWELFVSRVLPTEFQDQWQHLNDESQRIHDRDNIPLYHRVVLIEKTLKENVLSKQFLSTVNEEAERIYA